MAAAQHVQIQCGSSKIDGHAFCLGLRGLQAYLDESARSIQLTTLIHGAIFRSGHISKVQDRLSLEIRPLCELLDLYHASEATVPHDRVYALLGMASDDFSGADLDPDYSAPWDVLTRRLIKFLLGDSITVNTLDEHRVVIKSTGSVIGQVSFTKPLHGDGSKLEVDYAASIQHHGGNWLIISPLAKPIRTGDIICRFGGLQKYVIVRPCLNHFAVIAITATPAVFGPAEGLDDSHPDPFIRDIQLVWDFGQFKEQLIELEDDNNAIVNSSHPGSGLEDQLNHANREWNHLQVLGDSLHHEEAKKRDERVMQIYEKAVGSDHSRAVGQQTESINVPLLVAARLGWEDVVSSLLERTDIDHNARDWTTRTPISWAAGNGHDNVVRMLRAVDSGTADLAEFPSGRTALSWAAGNGHESVVELLLEMGNTEMDQKKDRNGWTALAWAAAQGHKSVVQILLGTGNVLIGRYDDGWLFKALHLAVEHGREAVVDMLLDTGTYEAITSLKEYNYGPPAAVEDVVRLLLETGTPAGDSTWYYARGMKLLSCAAKNGHEGIVKLILDAEQIHTPDKRDHLEAISWAAIEGHEATVKILIESGDADDEHVSSLIEAALEQAAEKGHEAIVRLLLEADKNTRISDSQLALAWRKANFLGHERIANLILEMRSNIQDYEFTQVEGARYTVWCQATSAMMTMQYHRQGYIGN